MVAGPFGSFLPLGPFLSPPGDFLGPFLAIVALGPPGDFLAADWP